MGRYSEATTEAQEITTRLRMDAKEVLDTLNAARVLLTGTDLDDTVEQLQRLWIEEGDRKALDLLSAIDRSVHHLSVAAISSTEFEYVDPTSLRPEERIAWVAEVSLRKTEVNSIHVPGDFFDNPNIID